MPGGPLSLVAGAVRPVNFVVVLLRRSLANPVFQQLAMHIQIAHRPGGSANPLELPQPRPGRLLASACPRAGFAQHGLERCLQPARAGSYAMHRLRIRILDTLRHGRVEVVRKRAQTDASRSSAAFAAAWVCAPRPVPGCRDGWYSAAYVSRRL